MTRPFLAIIVLLLLFVPLQAFAHENEYYTIIANDGPASNVVNAANFAASMKASAGVTFSGKSDSDLAAVPEPEAFLAYFDGKEVSLVYPPSNENNGIAYVAQRYLEEQGFTVTFGEPPKRDTSSASKDEQEQEEMPQPQAIDTQEPQPPAQQETEEQQEDPTPQPQPVADEETGFFSRVWRWFAGLFS